MIGGKIGGRIDRRTDMSKGQTVHVIRSKCVFMELAGLVLNAKLDLHKKFKVPEKLLKFEERMREREKKYLENYHGRKS